MVGHRALSRLEYLSLVFYNYVLHFLHIALIIFSVTGWMFCETKIWNLAALLLTLFSWYGLGTLLKKGDAYGYCVITDMQWKIRKRLGLSSLEGGYIKYLADRLFKRQFKETHVDQFTALVFFLCLLASTLTYTLSESC